MDGGSANRSVRDIGDELYGLTPSAFTAARDGYIAEAKNAGDRDRAGELATLKRPSAAAGLVNLVALREPGTVTDLLELGQRIREAQGRVTPTQLRDLSARRRKELDAIVALARSLAAQRGDGEPSRAVLTEVESTFAAAMADDAAGQLVSSGRTVKALSYSGFGQASDAASVFAPQPPATARPAGGKALKGDRASKADGADAKAKAAAEAAEREAADVEQRREAAAQRVSAARQRLAGTTTAEAEVEGAIARLDDQIAELRNQLEVAQRDARSARQARLAAERDLASAERLHSRYS